MEAGQFDSMLRNPAPPDDIAAEAELIDRGALACLLYTSGTSGPPRGVMQPHRAMLTNCEGAFELVRPLPRQATLWRILEKHESVLDGLRTVQGSR